MPDLIRTAQSFTVQMADKPGTLAGILSPLREAGVNLLAVHVFPRSRQTEAEGTGTSGALELGAIHF